VSDDAILSDRAALLANERARTEAGIASLEHELRSVVDSADTANIDDEHDPEGATIAFERARIQALIDHGRRHLDEVDAAGARVAGGEDARCRVCGVVIPAERLAALPATDVCVDCAERGR
jgi:DnaK suppressor protein